MSTSNVPKGQSHTILNTWKEIASYLDRGVRTVQRWERELQLPVHRVGKGTHAPVFAIASELNFWIITASRTNVVGKPEKEPVHCGGRKREAQLTATARLHQLAQAAAEASVRHRRQAEALEKNILALRSRFSARKSN